MSRITAMLALWCLCVTAARADKADQFFDDSKVQEIRLYFADSNWYNTLYQAHNSNSDDPYFPASFTWGDVSIPTIGARFKGNASFRRAGVKKSFKLDFNEYDESAKFLGMKKLNLHNGDLQPDFLREKLFYDFAAKYIPANRCVHVRLYVNDVYYGLYLATEQVDKTWAETRFGKDEDGNLFEAGESNASLAYLGTSASSYQKVFTLQTNETANDWSDLINFTNVLNNTATASLPAALEPICDVENMLYGIALNILFVNLDSYVGSGSEFYVYDRSDKGQFIHIHADLNENFGTTGDGSPSVANPTSLSPFYVPTSSGMGGGGGSSGGSVSRPLMSKLWAVDSYKRTYLRMLARMLREGFDGTSMQTKINRLANLIRTDVYNDPNKFFTNAQFETALNTQITSGNLTLLGLKQFVTNRYTYMRSALNAYAATSDVRLNEVVAVNRSTYKDAAGDADPWIELYNLGPGTVSLAGFYLTDDTSTPAKWALPSVSLADGGFQTIWLDGETGEGTTHANFTLSANGGTLYLYYKSGSTTTLIDKVTYVAASAGASLARIGETGNLWLLADEATPGAENPKKGTTPQTGSGLLKINEMVADNDSTLEDPDEPGAYEDWFEVYNPTSSAVDMGGMYISDNPLNPKKWQVPSGVSIPGGGHLVFWADNDTEQGSLHTNLNLDAGGEELSIFYSDGETLIDSVTYKQQQRDVAWGRTSDGAGTWSIFKPATPGAANASPYANWIVSAGSFQAAPLAPEAIAAAFGSGLATSTAAASAIPLPTELAGTEVKVTDSAGVTRAAPLFFVSAGQVNFQIPSGTADGRATVAIVPQGGAAVTGEILVDSIAPSLFSANSSGQGIGLMVAVRVDSTGAQTVVPVFAYDSALQKVVSTPVSLGAETDKLYLLIFGTGIRGVTDPANVEVEIDGVSVPVEYAAEQGSFIGLDQVNAGPLSQKLAGRGEVEIVLSTDGRRANAVTVNIE